jgi:hypothetical protein
MVPQIMPVELLLALRRCPPVGKERRHSAVVDNRYHLLRHPHPNFS